MAAPLEPAPHEIDGALERRRVVARRVSDAFAVHPSIGAVLVFGSVALGQVDERSDVDILAICPEELVASDERLAILTRLGAGWRPNDGGNALFAAGVSDGKIDDIAVDMHYQTGSLIHQVLTQVVEQGAITTSQVPFRPYTLAALIQNAWVLLDKDGLVDDWRKYISTYPIALKRNIIRHFSLRLREYTEGLVAGAERKLGPSHFIFHLDRAADAAVSILFAVNDMYDPAERRAERVILPRLKLVPDGFTSRFTDILAGPFDDSGALDRARLFEKLTGDVLALAHPYDV
jgi:predicted nucleotidyltransferase